MKIKVSEATNLQIDWAVAKCEGYSLTSDSINRLVEKGADLRILGPNSSTLHYSPSTDWAQGGPIIEQEKIQVQWDALLKSWTSRDKKDGYISHVGPTALIAAMRRYISFRLGDEVEIPEELK